MLHLEKIKRNDFGIYQCEAKNLAGSDLTQFLLSNSKFNKFI